MEQEQFERLEQYLRNELSTEEEGRMEQELKANKLLREEAKKLQIMLLALEEAGRNRLLTRLRKEDLDGNKLPSKFFSGWRIAASIALVIFGGAMLYRYLSAPASPETLASRYYEPLSTFQLSVNTGYLDKKETALELYQEGKYEETLLALNEIKPLPEDSDVPMIRGLGYMGLEEYPNAETEFKMVLKIDDHHVTEAKWYLSLSLLQNSKQEEALEMLQQLINSGNKYYHSKSMDLLNELE